MTSLGDALARAVRVLEKAGCPYMLVGGLAVVVWGEPRTTRDVDLTVDIGARSPADFLEIARSIGAPIAADPADVAVRGRLVPVRTPSDIEVDLILATLSFEIEAISRAVPIDVEGTSVRVCRAEDLVLQKIVSERARDHEDVLGILRRQGPRLDTAYLDELIENLARDLADDSVQERWTHAKRAAGA